MKITDIIKEKMTLSFEVFPPKNENPIAPLLENLDKLYMLKPDFISCTYGAGGTNIGRSSEVCSAIHKSGHECITHFTCISSKKQDIFKSIQDYINIGIKNILALRGDFPAGMEKTNGDFNNANELIEFIKGNFSGITLAAACYPEKHIQCKTMEEDIMHLKIKQDSGAEFLMSQLCFDVEAYAKWREKIRKAGVKIPVIIGIMPVINPNGIKRMTLLNGCSIPAKLASILGKYGEKPDEFLKAGKEYTAELITKYINEGVDGIHLYALNKYDNVADVLDMTGLRRVK